MAEVHTARPEHQTAIVGVLTDAFVDDPVMSWLLPDPARRCAALASFFTFEVEQVALHHTSSITAYDEGQVAGAALVLPPGHWKTPFWRQAVHGIRLTNVFRLRLGHAMVLQAMLERHHLSEPHYFVPFIGVSGGHRGRGLGGCLLTELGERCDREHLPAYLEATSPANVRLYQRHGFETIRRVTVGGSPPLELMRRAPRASE